MKLFKSNILLLSRASPVKSGKRFVSFFIDFIVVLLVSYFLFLGAFAITKNSDAYVSAGEIVSEEIAYYNDYAEETHVVEFLDKSTSTRKDTDVLVIENICRAIVHSYNVLGNDSEPDFTIDDANLTKFGEASAETDNVAYFYLRYIPNHPERNILDTEKDISVYYFDNFKSNFGANADMFSYNTEISEIPVLRTQIAYYLSYYLLNGEQGSIGEKGSDYYDKYYNGYSKMLNDAELSIIQSEPYYTSHYLVYRQYYFEQGSYTNICILVSIVVGYLIGAFLPKLLFKDQRTIGRLIMGLGVISKDGDKAPWYALLVNTIWGIIGFMSVMILMFMFPPFNGIFDFMAMPLFSTKITLLLILFIDILMSMVIYSVSLFTHYKQSLLDLILRVVVVDSHHLDEGDNDDPHEGKGD